MIGYAMVDSDQPASARASSARQNAIINAGVIQNRWIWAYAESARDEYESEHDTQTQGQ